MRHPEITRGRAELRESGLRDRDPDAYRQRTFELAVAGYFADPANARDLTPFRATGRTQTGVWRSLGRYDIRDRLATLDVPALVVHGAHDPIPLETAQDTAALLRTECIVMEHSGHVPYVEEYERFVSTFDAFLPRT